MQFLEKVSQRNDFNNEKFLRPSEEIVAIPRRIHGEITGSFPRRISEELFKAIYEKNKKAEIFGKKIKIKFLKERTPDELLNG